MMNVSLPRNRRSCWDINAGDASDAAVAGDAAVVGRADRAKRSVSITPKTAGRMEELTHCNRTQRYLWNTYQITDGGGGI